MDSTVIQRIVIVGAGFAGIRCALDMRKHRPRGVKITLISANEYFEYYPAMYRVATGSSPIQACVPLREIFQDDAIEIVHDTIVAVDAKTKTLTGETGSTYTADVIILAVGSQTTYFGIEGVEKYSFNFKSVQQALHLKRRIVELFENYNPRADADSFSSLRFVIVGGGASGVELAGELAHFTSRLSKRYNIESSNITIDLVEGAPRILRTFSKKVSSKVTKRLRALGVHVHANQLLVKSEEKAIFLRDMEVKTHTVVWTAGVTNNQLYKTLADTFEFDGRGRVVVDEYLQARGYTNIFVVGDSASTEFAGLAQTALYDGSFVARHLRRVLQNKSPRPYVSKKVSHDVPVGPGWGVLITNGITIYGRIAWIMRHLIDLRFYFTILPFHKALRAFFSGYTAPLPETTKQEP